MLRTKELCMVLKLRWSTPISSVRSVGGIVVEKSPRLICCAAFANSPRGLSWRPIKKRQNTKMAAMPMIERVSVVYRSFRFVLKMSLLGHTIAALQCPSFNDL